MDGGSYKEECNEVQVRRNKLCSWCTCTSLSVNVEWTWLYEYGAGEGRGTEVAQAISPSVSDLPSRAPPSITFVKQQQPLHNPII